MAIPLKGFFTWWWSGQNGSNRAPIPNHLKWSCWLLYWWHWHWHWHRCHFVATNNEQEWMIASVLLSEPTGCIWCVRLMGGGTDVGAPSPIHRAPVLHASPHKCYTSTNTQAQTLNASTEVQIHKHKYTSTDIKRKYTSTNTQAQIHKYTSTNTQIQIHKHKHTNTQSQT